MKKSKGFTLVELMVVIVIIGILAALAIPRFMGATNKSKATEFKPVLKSLYTLQKAYQQERNLYATDISLIGFDNPGSTARFSYSTTNTKTDPTTAVELGRATYITGKGINDLNGTELAAGSYAIVDTSSTQTVSTKELGTLTNLDVIK